MMESIDNASVAVSLIMEALSLLDEPQHSKAAAHLRDAIKELSPDTRQELSTARKTKDLPCS